MGQKVTINGVAVVGADVWTEATLLDNSGPVSVPGLTWDVDHTHAVLIDIMVYRGTNPQARSSTLHLVIRHEAFAEAKLVEVGGMTTVDDGVTLVAAIIGSDVVIRYYTTSTGADAKLSYFVRHVGVL